MPKAGTILVLRIGDIPERLDGLAFVWKSRRSELLSAKPQVVDKYRAPRSRGGYKFGPKFHRSISHSDSYEYKYFISGKLPKIAKKAVHESRLLGHMHDRPRATCFLTNTLTPTAPGKPYRCQYRRYGGAIYALLRRIHAFGGGLIVVFL